MSKETEQTAVAYQLVDIQIISSRMDIPDDFKRPRDYQFDILLSCKLSEDTDVIKVTNQVKVFQEKDAAFELASIKADYIFTLSDGNTIKAFREMKSLPKTLQLSLNSIAVSTTRGLLHAYLKGTALQSAILPLVDIV